LVRYYRVCTNFACWERAAWLPIFDRPIDRVPTVTLAGVADILADIFPGQDRESLSERFRKAARSGYIPRRWDGGVYTYGPEGVGTGALLIAVYDYFKINDAETSNEVLRACNSWSDINPRPPHVPQGVPPIVAASVGVTRGEYWTYKLCPFHCTKTNQRYIVSEVYDVSGPMPEANWLPTTFLAVGTLNIALWPLLVPIDRIYDGLRASAKGRLDA
jgi:hypothetical protein